MMLKFSDLNATSCPPRVFPQLPQKPSVPVSRKTTTFSDSQTARDWKNLSLDMSSVFSSVPLGKLKITENHSYLFRNNFVFEDTNSQSDVLPQDDLPPWCSADASTLPPIYNIILSVYKKQSLLDKTAVFNLLDRSGLSRTTLAQIWKCCCRTNPGSLSRDELCAALALTGLAQVFFFQKIGCSAALFLIRVVFRVILMFNI